MSFESSLKYITIDFIKRNCFQKEAPSSEHKNSFLSQVLLRLQQLGAENILKLKELEQNKQVRTLEQKLLMSENDLKSKKKDLEEERNSFVAKLNALEREKAMIKANESSLNEKVKEVKMDYEQQLKRSQETLESLRESLRGQEREFVEKFKAQEEKFNNLRTSAHQNINELEKQNALLSQEMSFSKREISGLQGKIESLEAENRRLKMEMTAQTSNLEKTKQRVNEVENIKNQEIGFVKNEAEKRLKEVMFCILKSKGFADGERAGEKQGGPEKEQRAAGRKNLPGESGQLLQKPARRE